MTHPRRQIRTLAAAHLIGATRAGDRVLTSQPMPQEPDSLPAEFIAALQPTPDPEP